VDTSNLGDIRVRNHLPIHARAFTLIELLVVITIISLLISMLLPALSKSREAARRTMCMGNVRSVMISIMTYSNDHRNLLPDGGFSGNAYDHYMNSPGGNGTGWSNPRGLGILAYNGYIDSLKGFYCPSRNGGAFSLGHPNRIGSIADYKTKIDNYEVTFRGFFNYLYRGVRWSWNSQFPSWGPSPSASSNVNASGYYGPYLTHIDRIPKRADNGSLPSGLAIVSDDWSWIGNTGFGAGYGGYDLPQGQYYHRDGYNVAYTDGRVRWIPDKKNQILDRGTPGSATYTAGNFANLHQIVEDIWNAFDNDKGTDYTNVVKNLE